MPKRRWSPEERTTALELYRTDGPATASEATGIPQGTIASWANRAGLQSECNENRATRVVAARLKWEERRVELAHEMGRLASKALACAERELDDRSMRDAQAAVTTCAILVDKAQVLTGEASVRVEHRHVDKLDQELEALAQKLEAQATG